MIEKIKNELTVAMKQKNNDKVNILRVALGELQRSFKTLNNNECINIIKKIIQGNSERINEYAKNNNEIEIKKLENENIILSQLLPQELSKDETRNILLNISDEIKSFKNEGQAIGISMKKIQSIVSDKIISNKYVIEVIKEIRNC